MTVLEKTKEALNLSNLKLPPYPRVLAITAEESEDHEFEPILRVQVVIDEETEIEKVTGAMATQLKSAIRQSIRDHGVDVFAVIFIAKPSELAESNDDSEADEDENAE